MVPDKGVVNKLHNINMFNRQTHATSSFFHGSSFIIQFLRYYIPFSKECRWPNFITSTCSIGRMKLLRSRNIFFLSGSFSIIQLFSSQRNGQPTTQHHYGQLANSNSSHDIFYKIMNFGKIGFFSLFFFCQTASVEWWNVFLLCKI